MKIDEKTGLYGNYGLWHKPFWQTTTFYAVVGIVVFLFMVVLLCFFIKKYRTKRKERVLPAWQVALQQLASLQKNNKVAAVHGKEFYVTVTAILKNYLQKRFDFDLQGKTDGEVIAYLEKERQSVPELLSAIREIFSGGLFIKFANKQAVQQQIENDFKQSIRLIKQTIPQSQTK